MPKQNKFTYYKVIQENWGNGWDDVDFEEVNTVEARKLFKENLKAYRDNSPALIRVINRRVLKEATA